MSSYIRVYLTSLAGSIALLGVLLTSGGAYGVVFAGANIGDPDINGDQVQLRFPTGVDVDPEDGSVFIADFGNARVLKAAADGNDVRVVAGTGQTGSGPFQPDDPLQTKLAGPRDVCVLADGSLLIAEEVNARVLRLLADGTRIERFVATGLIEPYRPTLVRQTAQGWEHVTPGPHELTEPQEDYMGNRVIPNDPIASKIMPAHGVAKANDGAVFITTWASNILKVENGVISVFAGKLDKGWNVITSLDNPVGICVKPDHSVLVADSYNNRVLQLTASGTATAIAGTGRAGSFIDPTDPTQTKLNDPAGLAIAPNGSLLIVDRGNHRVLRVSDNNEVSLVVGTGTAGDHVDPDDVPTRTQLNTLLVSVYLPLTVLSLLRIPVTIVYYDLKETKSMEP